MLNYCAAGLFFITKTTISSVVSASATGTDSHSPMTPNNRGRIIKAATKNTTPLIKVYKVASPARSTLWRYPTTQMFTAIKRKPIE